MAIKTIRPDFAYREFKVRVVQQDRQFIAVGFDKTGEIARAMGNDVEEVEKDIKQKLNQLSNDFVTIEGAINLFQKAYPEGFGSPFYEFVEGDYKAEAAAFVEDRLSAERLARLIAEEDFPEIAVDAKRAVSKTNLPSQFEIMAFSDFLKKESNVKPFAQALQDLLYGDDFETAFARFVEVLSGPENAAKWPIVTYFPFFRFPQEHVFVKPNLFETCAYRLGYELAYEPKPNIATYRSCVGLVETIREETQFLAPRDNIDIQTFMYVVATDGYVAEVTRSRERWQAKNQDT